MAKQKGSLEKKIEIAKAVMTERKKIHSLEIGSKNQFRPRVE